MSNKYKEYIASAKGLKLVIYTPPEFPFMKTIFRTDSPDKSTFELTKAKLDRLTLDNPEGKTVKA